MKKIIFLTLLLASTALFGQRSSLPRDTRPAKTLTGVIYTDLGHSFQLTMHGHFAPNGLSFSGVLLSQKNNQAQKTCFAVDVFFLDEGGTPVFEMYPTHLNTRTATTEFSRKIRGTYNTNSRGVLSQLFFNWGDAYHTANMPESHMGRGYLGEIFDGTMGVSKMNPKISTPATIECGGVVIKNGNYVHTARNYQDARRIVRVADTTMR